jgi:inosose dehydratase
VALTRPDTFDEGIAQAVRTARLLSEASGPDAFLVLSDDSGSVSNRTQRAGRIRNEDGLTDDQWTAFAQRAEHVATEVRRAAGLRTVFHHHCAGYVETPPEIGELCSRTDPALVGLCLDTGHLTFAGGDPLAALATWGDRIWHVHFKDCDPELAMQSRKEGWDYHQSVRRGIFCELGRGTVPFAGVLDGLRARGYSGWIVVEQDVLPGLGTPAASAARNREYLRRLGI